MQDSINFNEEISCGVNLEYFNDSYWVFYADSLGISDTLRVSNPVFSEAKGCCACPEMLGGDFDLAGDVGNSPEIVRYY